MTIEMQCKKHGVRLTQNGMCDVCTRKPCLHSWVSNSGRGGKPKFKNTGFSPTSDPLMHVKCQQCNTRTWFTRSQWLSARRNRA